MASLGQLTSIDRLMTAPGAIEISQPRQLQPHNLENRLAAPPAPLATANRADALRALETAKPLL